MTTPRIETKVLQFTPKGLATEVAGEPAGDGSTFEGFAAATCNIDGWGDIILPGAFAETIPFYMARGSVRDSHRKAVGKPTACREVPGGLWLAGKISDTAEGKDCKILLRDGVVKGLSVGIVPQAVSYVASLEVMESVWAGLGYTPTEDDYEAFARALASEVGAVRLIEKCKLFEVSLTDMPANDLAAIVTVKSHGGGAPSLAHEAAQAVGSVELLARRCEAAGSILPAPRLAELKALHARLGALVGPPSPTAPPTLPAAEPAPEPAPPSVAVKSGPNRPTSSEVEHLALRHAETVYRMGALGIAI